MKPNYGIAACAALLAGASQAHALAFDIRPIDFGNGIVASGTINTTGNSAMIDGWNISVTMTEQLARYRPANTGLRNVSLASVSADGQQLDVATSPDSAGGADGGTLGFRAPNPFMDLGVWLADFSAGALPGGQSQYLAGAAFDIVPLGQADGTRWLAATARAGGANLFDLVPIDFGGGVTVHGTLTTNGATGPLTASDILDWDIVVEQITQDVFSAANSTVQQTLVALNADATELDVGNPGGYLSFVKGFSGGHLYALTLADFTDGSPFFGEAVYSQGRLALHETNLRARRGPWTVTGADPIVAADEPQPIALLPLAAAALGLRRRRRENSLIRRRHVVERPPFTPDSDPRPDPTGADHAPVPARGSPPPREAPGSGGRRPRAAGSIPRFPG